MSRKLTTGEFINNAIKIHGNRFDYSEVKYNGNKVKVNIICKEHGVFSQKPNNHISLKQGCPKCKAEKISLLYSKNQLEFIEKANKIHKGRYSYNKTVYTKSIEKIIIRCHSHGYFKQEANSHLQGHGCPTCGVEKNTKLPRELRPLMKKTKCVIHQSFFRKNFTKKSRTYKLLGCSWIEFKSYLEKNDYGFKVDDENIDLDHIIPSSSAKNEQDIIKLNHYTNFQLLPSKYNQNIKRNNTYNKVHFEKWLKQNI